jgi:hypothetical protein
MKDKQSQYRCVIFEVFLTLCGFLSKMWNLAIHSHLIYIQFVADLKLGIIKIIEIDLEFLTNVLLFCSF